MKIYYKLPIILLLLIPLTLPAQKRWSLKECIKYAWDNNLSIKQQEIDVEQSENNVQLSKLQYLPSLSASVGHSMNWGRSVNMQDLKIIENKLSQSTSSSLSSSVNLFEGLRKNNDLKSKKVMHEISIQEVDKIKNEISVGISRSYLQILLSKEILQTALQSLESVNQQTERTRKLVDAGSVAYSSLLELEAQLATERVQVVNAQNQVNNSLLALRQMLDLTHENNFDIEVPDLNLVVNSFAGESVENLFDYSRNLPQVKSAELNYKNSNLQLAIAKGSSYPSLSFSAGYGTYYSDSREEKFMDQFNENRNPSISFGLRIPIFDNGQINNTIKNARLNVRKAEIAVKNTEQALYKEIQQANSDALGYFEKYKASMQNVKAMEESFRYVQQKFDVGVLNATDYTVAKANLFKAQSDCFQAKYQYVFQLKILDFYKGIPITL